VLLRSLVAGVAVGSTLGFFGSGGSILALPALVYVLHIDPKSAVAMSLVIVGITAAFGAAQRARAGELCYRVAAIFGSAGIVTAFLGARLSRFLHGNTQLILFGLLMIVAAGLMLRNARKVSPPVSPEYACRVQPWKAVSVGGALGFIQGIVGVGGGFLIVPALTHVTALNLRLAMGTSLLIIAITTFAGALGYVGVAHFEWLTMGVFLLGALTASAVATHVGKRLEVRLMSHLFAAFVMVIGIAITVWQLR